MTQLRPVSWELDGDMIVATFVESPPDGHDDPVGFVPTKQYAVLMQVIATDVTRTDGVPIGPLPPE